MGTERSPARRRRDRARLKMLRNARTWGSEVTVRTISDPDTVVRVETPDPSIPTPAEAREQLAKL